MTEVSEVKDSIEELRTSGNDEFSKKNFQKALESYTRALEILDKEEDGSVRAALLSNCSACFFRMKQFNEAAYAADESLKADPFFTKACNRKALSLKALSKPFEALRCYKDFLVSLQEKVDSMEDEPIKKNDSEDDEGEPQQQLYFIDKSSGLDEVKFISHGRKGEMQRDISFIKTKINELESSLKSINGAEKLKAYVAEAEFPTLLNGPKGAKPTQSMFELLDCVGEGNYSQVFRVKFKPTNEIFAMKVIDKKKIDRMSRRHKNIYNEIKLEKFIMQKRFKENSSNPNISKTAKLVGTFQNNSSIYFIYELNEQGEVWDLLRYSNKFNKQDKDLEFLMIGLYPSLVKFFLSQAVNAMLFFKSCNYVHRDIKPENMLLTAKDLHFLNDGKSIQEVTLLDNQEKLKNSRLCYMKLIDFGTGLDLLDEDPEINSKQYFVGTPEYMSYEALKSQRPSYALDAWSFACTAYQLYSGLIPFRGGSPYYCYLRSKKLAYMIPDTMPLDLFDLIKRVLFRNPENRLSIEDIKRHEYFKDVDFDALNTAPLKPIASLVELCVAKIGDLLCNVKYKKLKNSSYIERKFRKVGIAFNPDSNNFVFSDEYLRQRDKKFGIVVDGITFDPYFESRFLSFKNKFHSLQICNKNILKSGYAVQVMELFKPKLPSPRNQISVPSAVNVGRMLKGFVSQRGMLKFGPLSSLFFAATDSFYRFIRPQNNFYQGFNRYNNVKFRGNFNILTVPNLTLLDPSLLDAHKEILEAVVARINSIKEFKPHMIFFTDGFKDDNIDEAAWIKRVDVIQSILSKIDAVFPLAFAPGYVPISATGLYEKKYGSSYYSLFLQGNKIVTVDTCLLQHLPEKFIEFWKETTQKAREEKKGGEESDGEVVAVDKDDAKKDTEEADEVDSDNDSFKSEDSEPIQNDTFNVEFITPDMEVSWDYTKDSMLEKEAIRHFIWLENELFSAKFEGRHLVVRSFHDWSTFEPCSEKYSLPAYIQEYFLPRIRHSCGQVILTSNNDDNSRENRIFKEKEVGMFSIRLQHVYTKQFLEDSIDKGSLRVLKMMSTDVKVEQYHVQDLPKYLVMPEDHYVEDENGEESDSSFSTSSFDSSDDTASSDSD